MAPNKEKGAFFPAEIPFEPRPRRVGVTHILDRLSGLDPQQLTYLAPYIDVAKIGWGLPLLVRRETLHERIGTYHDAGIQVSTGGTLLEYAVTHSRVPQLLDEAKGLGFDLIEISSGIIELSFEQIDHLAEAVTKRGLQFLIEVGKKDTQHQLSLKETNAQVAHARSLKPVRVILESRESGRGVGIYDSDGGIKWDWVRSIVSEHPSDELLFEAPLEIQQVQLIRELGSDVNLGNIAMASVAPLASERRGLRGETFGAIRRSQPVKGPPAAKFLFFLLETYRGLDQAQLVHMSRLPRRTVQSALESLRQQGLIEEAISLTDSRRREYRLA